MQQQVKEFDFTTFGEKYISADAVKGDLTRLPALEQELQTLKQQVEQTKLNPQTERLAKVQAILKDGKVDSDIAWKLSGMTKESLSSMTDNEVLKLKMVMDNKAFEGNEMLQNDAIEESYYQLPTDELENAEERMAKWKAIIQSMTVDEKENPKILNRSRIQRVARGSGTDERDVKELIKQYNTMRKMLKKMKGSRRMRRQIPIKFS